MKYGEGSMGDGPEQRPFAVFDIDGTVIRWQLYHAIVSKLAQQGHLSPKAEAVINEARMTWKTRTHSQSFSEYESILVRTYLDALSSVSRTDYNQAINEVFDEYKDQVYTYTRNLIRDLKDKGYLLFVISGSHQEIIGKLADYYGFDDTIGSIFEEKDGHFTGKVDTPYDKKGKLLQQLAAKHGVGFKGSVAVGDSGSDIAMLELVEHPIAFNPDKTLLNAAKKHEWKIVVERKNVVYHLEPIHGSYVLAQTDG